MFDLSRDRLLIGISPDELSTVRLSGAWRKRVVAAQVIECDASAGEGPWHGVLAALTQFTTGLAGEAIDATIVLSNHFVRYALVPWSQALEGVDEELAFARHTFVRIHGERAKGWEVRIGNEAAGAARLAGAIDRGLADALNACFPATGKPRLVSVLPHLMSAFILSGRLLPRDGDGWFLVIEPGRACVALRAKGCWSAVRTARGSFDDSAAWADLLDHERHRVDAHAPDEVAVYAPRNGQRKFPAAGRWKLFGLALPQADGPAAAILPRLALALSAR